MVISVREGKKISAVGTVLINRGVLEINIKNKGYYDLIKSTWNVSEPTIFIRKLKERFCMSSVVFISES